MAFPTNPTNGEQAMVGGITYQYSSAKNRWDKIPYSANYFSGNYADLTNKPSVPADISELTDSTNLLVHFSGDYTNLTNTPTLFSGDYTDLLNKPVLADVATSGSYNDLTNTPTIPADVSELTDTTNLLVHFSGDYTNLTNTPTLFSGDYTDLLNKPVLADVATSGSYNDLTNTPTIPADVSELTDTTNLLDHFSGDYNDLINKPAATDLTGYATETYVTTAISNLVDTAPTTLDTLNELAAALGDDPNFATSLSTQIGLKANTADLATVATSGSYNDLLGLPDLTEKLDISGGTLTGSLILSGDPTAELEAATKQYVDAATASTTIESINDISDVDVTSPVEGQVLKFNGLTWSNETITQGDALPSQDGNAGKLLTTDGTTVSWTAPALVAGVASYTKEVFTATSGQTEFLVDYSVGYIDVYVNGIKFPAEDYIAVNGTSIELLVQSELDDIIEVVVWQNIPNAAYTRYSYTATSGQTEFAAEYYIGTVDVYVNGIKLLDSSDFTATNGTSITLDVAAEVDDVVEIVAWQNITATSGVNLLPSQDGNTGYILSTDGSTASWIPAPTGVSGDYNDLTNTPTIPVDVSDLTDTTGLLDHFSGDYADLTNKPTLFSGSYTDLTNRPTLSTVATTGSYNDLTDKPAATDLTGYATETYVNTAISNLVDIAPTTLDTLNELAAALGDDANFATTVTNQIALKANTADLASVATSGSYNDLLGLPDLTEKLDISGGTLTGSLILSGDPTAELEAATKQYVDAATASATIASINDISDVDITLPESGQVLQFNGLSWVNAAASGTIVAVTGDAPSNPGTGDLWYDDTTTGQLFVYDGTAWVTTAISPASQTIDISSTPPTDGQALVWDAANSVWTPGTVASGGSGSGITWTIGTTAPTSPEIGDRWQNTTNDVIYEYQSNGTSSYWVDISTSDVVNDITGVVTPTSIDDLTDVDTTTAAPTDGQALVWDNANSVWKPNDVTVSYLQSVDLIGGYTEQVYTLASSGTIILDPSNGSIQTSALSGDVTFTDNLSTGQSITLLLTNGSSNIVTWPTITWVSSTGNTAPTLTGTDTIVIWKIASTLYGSWTGSSD